MNAEALDKFMLATAAVAVGFLLLVTFLIIKQKQVRVPVTEDTRRIRAVRLIIILAWAASTVPSLIQNLTTPRRANAVVDVTASTNISSLTAYASAGLLIAYCLLQILSAKTTPVAKRLGGVGLVLLPWVIAVFSSLLTGANIPVNAMALPVTAIALWRLSAKLDDLVPVAWLTGLTAVIALLMGLLLPDRGLLHGASGMVAMADKAILGDTLLAGPFNHSNQLGVVLALGLPVIFLLRSAGARFVIFVVVAVALTWSGSRGCMAAAGAAVLVAWLVGKLRSGALRSRWSFMVLVVAVGAVAYIPLSTDSLEAYSDRGQIWLASMQAWAGSPAFGNGYSWYGDIGKFANNLTEVSFNGHNLFVHVMVTGGLVLLLAVAVLTIRLIAASSTAARLGNMFPMTYLVSFFLTAALEVPTRFRDVDPLFWICVVPLVVIAMTIREPSPTKDAKQGTRGLMISPRLT